MTVLEKLDALLNGPTAPQAAVPRQPKTVAVFPDPATRSGFEGANRPDPTVESVPLSPEAQRELTATLRPAPPKHALAGVPWPNPAQQRAFDALLKQRGYAPPKAVAAELAKLDAPWTRLQQAIGEAAKSQGDAYHRHMQDIARRTAEGDETVKREDSWSRADWDADARERIAAFKVECKRIEAQAWKIAEPALLAKAAAADAAADALEDEARQPFEAFAVPFSPPPYVPILRVYAASLRDGSRRNVGKPSSMLESL